MTENSRPIYVNSSKWLCCEPVQVVNMMPHLVSRHQNSRFLSNNLGHIDFYGRIELRNGLVTFFKMVNVWDNTV